MSSSGERSWGNFPVRFTPGRATLLGAGIGGLITLIIAVAPPHDYSVRELTWILTGLMLSGALFGYTFFLASDPLRGERLTKISRWVGFLAITILLAAFPRFWINLFARNSGLACITLGFVASLAYFGTGLGFGIADLVRSRMGPEQRTAANAVSQTVEDYNRD